VGAGCVYVGGHRLHFNANVGLAATSVVDIFHAGRRIGGKGHRPWPGRVSLVRFGHFWDCQWQWCKLDFLRGVLKVRKEMYFFPIILFRLEFKKDL